MNNEDKQITIRVRDLAARCTRKDIPLWSGFLNEHQASLAVSTLKDFPHCGFTLWGGYEDACRTVLCVYPLPCEPPKSDYPIECLSVTFREKDTLTHRDFLGALMSLGIERDAVGDILVSKGSTVFFVKSELVSYITTQLDIVGRVGVRFCGAPTDFSEFKQSYTEHMCTVSSMRMDNIVAAALTVSRTRAQSMITSGLVVKNYEIVYSADRKVCDGDVISVRGFGKFAVAADGSTTKKGKYKVTINQYS